MREPNVTFLEQLVGHQGHECVTWPFGRDTHGYGQVLYDGKIRRASRVICEFVNGPPHDPALEAAHSCGKGHDGCVNPNHIFWKTHEDNMGDMREHGTIKKRGCKRRKLTDEQVAQIRAMAGTATYRAIGNKYGVNHRTVGLIIIGRERQDRPKRHGIKYPEPQRSIMKARAKELRAMKKSYYEIANIVGCSRVTAAVFVRE